MAEEIEWRREDLEDDRLWARYAIMLADMRGDAQRGGEILAAFERGYTIEEAKKIFGVRGKLASAIEILHAEFLKRGKKHPQ
jgi:hypothetical protein